MHRYSVRRGTARVREDMHSKVPQCSRGVLEHWGISKIKTPGHATACSAFLKGYASLLIHVFSSIHPPTKLVKYGSVAPSPKNLSLPNRIASIFLDPTAPKDGKTSLRSSAAFFAGSLRIF